ncbi:transposase [Streptomyces sp. NBC_00667]|uniref:transposase n=1 Tax=unclassified Streptomyces TaxID=2593676 RepID=UPI003FA70899
MSRSQKNEAEGSVRVDVRLHTARGLDAALTSRALRSRSSTSSTGQISSASQSVSRSSSARVAGRNSGRRLLAPGVPLPDAQWSRIEPLLPDRTPRRGGRWRDHREVIDAIAWKFQTASQSGPRRCQCWAA